MVTFRVIQHSSKRMLMLHTIERHHVYADDLDLEIVDQLGVVADNIIFLSKHKSASEKKALTVHPIGNWGKADLGGKDGELTPAAPHLMSALLRTMKKTAAHLADYDIVFEVTHHGPYWPLQLYSWKLAVRKPNGPIPLRRVHGQKRYFQ